MRKFNIDVATLSETNLHFNNPQVTSYAKSHQEILVKKKTNHFRDSPHMAIKMKPGGIAIIVTNTLSHKVTKSGHDSEGL